MYKINKKNSLSFFLLNLNILAKIFRKLLKNKL